MFTNVFFLNFVTFFTFFNIFYFFFWNVFYIHGAYGIASRHSVSAVCVGGITVMGKQVADGQVISAVQRGRNSKRARTKARHTGVFGALTMLPLRSWDVKKWGCYVHGRPSRKKHAAPRGGEKKRTSTNIVQH